MNLLKWYRDWRFRRALRRFVDVLFRESPIQRYLREKHGDKIVGGEMNMPRQYVRHGDLAPLPPFGPPKHIPENLAKLPMSGDEVE